MLYKVHNIVKDSGNRLSTIDKNLSEIYNSSIFENKNGKEYALEQYNKLLDEKEDVEFKIDDVLDYLSKLSSDISRLKSGFFENLIHKKRIKNLEKDINNCEDEVIDIFEKPFELIEKNQIPYETQTNIKNDIEQINKQIKEETEIKATESKLNMFKFKKFKLQKEKSI